MSMSPAPSSDRPPAPVGWGAHARATLRLGAPLVLAQLAQQSLTLTDTIMLGWLGARPLAGQVLGFTLYFFAFIAGTGFAQAVMPMAATAEGEGDVRGVRRAVRMGLWVTALVTAATMPALWLSAPLLRATGQEPELSAMAQDYLRIAEWALFPAVWFMVLRSYLSALERAAMVMWAMFAGAALNVLLNWMLIFGNWGAPALGLRGAALATLVSELVILAIVALYAARAPGLKRYTLFVRFHRPDREAFVEVWRLGLPISATLLAEVGLFSASSLMMGWLGAVALAAHGIALQVTSVIFMVPLGLSAAATVRVGRAWGRRDPRGIHRAALTVLALSVGVAVSAALLLWLAPGPLVTLFLDRANPEADAIVATGAALLAVAAVFQIVDTLQVVSAGLLRGLKDTRRPMLIAVVSYWAVGLPTAYLLGFPLGWGGTGIWAGLAAGLACAATLLTRRFFRLRAALAPL